MMSYVKRVEENVKLSAARKKLKIGTGTVSQLLDGERKNDMCQPYNIALGIALQTRRSDLKLKAFINRAFTCIEKST